MSKPAKLIAVILISIIALITAAAPALAEVGLRVQNAIAQIDAVPGKSYIHKMTVESMEGYPAMDVDVSVYGLGETLDGGYRALTASEANNSPFSGDKFVTKIDNASFHLAPGGIQEVLANINIPSTAKITGGKYAVLHIKPKLNSTSAVVFVPEIFVPVVLNFGSWDIKGKITGAQVDKVESGKPVVCNVVLKNTGNYHYRAKTQVTIKNAAGDVVATATTTATSVSIIPSYSYQFPVHMDPQKPLPIGSYSVGTKAMLDNDKALDTYNTTFEVVRNYVRFQTEAEAPAGANWAFVGGTIVFVVGAAFLILGVAARRRRI